MAQWAGGFQGHTHETRVRDLEESLRRALTGLNAASNKTDASTAKRIRQLSERLLDCRVHMLRARISALTALKAENSHQLPRLKRKLEKTIDDGVEGIMKEFGAG